MINKLAQKSLFVFIAGILALGLAGCAESKYIDALNPALTAYNASTKDVNAQISKLNSDNTLISDATWQSDTNNALDAMDKAAKAFASLPEAPDSFKTVDGLVKDLAFETNSLVESYHGMMTSGDLSQLDAANAHMDNINSLIGKLNDAISAANK